MVGDRRTGDVAVVLADTAVAVVAVVVVAVAAVAEGPEGAVIVVATVGIGPVAAEGQRHRERYT